MKSLLYRHFLLVGVALLQCFTVVLVGCSKRNDELEQVKVPMWNDSDIEARKLEENESIYIYSVIRHDRPKYYKGRMPLSYQAGYPPWGMRAAISGEEIPLFYDFGDFKNWFVYQGPLLMGARTQDKKSGRLLAEARLRYFITDDGKQGIEAEEIHYGADEKPAFFCESKISDDGFKIAEKSRMGRKNIDYYFIWPTR